MSEVNEPTNVERLERYNCLDSWVIRGTLALLFILGLATLIGGLAYMDARNNRSNPIEIQHYPGLQLVEETEVSDGQRNQRYEGAYTGISLLLISEIESHYRNQMDSCFRLSDQPTDVDEPLNDNDDFHTVICQIDRSHDLLGFTQFTKLEIYPVRDVNNILTGSVVVLVNDRWES